MQDTKQYQYITIDVQVVQVQLWPHVVYEDSCKNARRVLVIVSDGRIALQ